MFPQSRNRDKDIYVPLSSPCRVSLRSDDFHVLRSSAPFWRPVWSILFQLPWHRNAKEIEHDVRPVLEKPLDTSSGSLGPGNRTSFPQWSFGSRFSMFRSWSFDRTRLATTKSFPCDIERFAGFTRSNGYFLFLEVTSQTLSRWNELFLQKYPDLDRNTLGRWSQHEQQRFTNTTTLSILIIGQKP